MDDLHNLLNVALWPELDRSKFNSNKVRDVIRCHPHVARVKNNFKGMGVVYPLFIVIVLGASKDVIESFCDAWPRALQDVTARGSTALHLACTFRAHVDVIRVLVNRWSGALRERDDWGFTPLHCACKHYKCGDSLEVIQVLLEGDPQVLRPTSKLSYTPWRIAMESKHTSPEGLLLLASLHVLLGIGGEFGAKRVVPRKEAMTVLKQFSAMRWKGGVALALDTHPSLISATDLELKVIPPVLAKVGRDCKLQTMWEAMRGMPDILKDAGGCVDGTNNREFVHMVMD